MIAMRLSMHSSASAPIVTVHVNWLERLVRLQACGCRYLRLVTTLLLAMASRGVRDQRRYCLQLLSDRAVAAGVGKIATDASKKTVQGVVDAIVASHATVLARKGAVALHEKYLGTFKISARSKAAAAPPRPPPSSVGPAQEKRIRGKGFQNNYNWDFFGTPLPDGTPPFSDVDALWLDWQRWRDDRVEKLKALYTTDTIEKSLQSDLAGRVHIHWRVDLRDAVDWRNSEEFRYHGIRPMVCTTHEQGFFNQKKARGSSYDIARNCSHFYVWAPKLGTLKVATNYEPFKSFRVFGKWVENLWGDGKLDHDTYVGLSLRVRVGHAARMRDLDVVRAGEPEQKIDAQIAAVNREHASMTLPFRTFPEITAWEGSFLKVAFRWKVLVLTGDSQSGKSTFAASLLDNPYTLTVESADALDLKGFKRDSHDGIVLDNVNSWAQLLRWRALLQARNAKSKGGQSATMVYAYPQYLFGVPFVASIDLDAPDADLVDEHSPKRSNWLLSNCVIVRLKKGEAFFDNKAAAPPPRSNTFSLFAETVRKRRRFSS